MLIIKIGNPIIRTKHFKEKLIKDDKRKKLKWELLHAPTIHTEKALKCPFVLPCASIIRKAPKIRLFQKDEIGNFENDDITKIFNDLTAKNASPDYLCHQTKDFLFITKFVLMKSDFSVVKEAIKISNDMYVYLQIQGNPVPLPQWFINEKNAILTSMPENFPSCLGNIYSTQNILLNEMNQIQFYKAKGRPPYSTSMIRFVLLLCYTSPQAYRLF